MKNRSYGQDLLPSRLKQLVVDVCRLDLLEPALIADDEPLFSGSFGLDSFDAIELAICIEEEFGIAICDREMSHRAFANIASLARFIRAGAPTSHAHAHRPAAARIARPALPLPLPG